MVPNRTSLLSSYRALMAWSAAIVAEVGPPGSCSCQWPQCPPVARGPHPGIFLKLQTRINNGFHICCLVLSRLSSNCVSLKGMFIWHPSTMWVEGVSKKQTKGTNWQGGGRGRRSKHQKILRTAYLSKFCTSLHFLSWFCTGGSTTQNVVVKCGTKNVGIFDATWQWKTTSRL